MHGCQTILWDKLGFPQDDLLGFGNYGGLLWVISPAHQVPHPNASDGRWLVQSHGHGVIGPWSEGCQPHVQIVGGLVHPVN
eukprot:41103-Pyramimonas_sp.AAC.2